MADVSGGEGSSEGPSAGHSAGKRPVGSRGRGAAGRRCCGVGTGPGTAVGTSPAEHLQQSTPASPVSASSSCSETRF